MDFTEIAGWIVVAILAIVLVAQSVALRRFTRPRRADSADLPSLTVVVVAAQDDTATRHAISSVTALDYEGPIEILLMAPSPGTDDLQSLAMASSRVRVLDGSATDGVSWNQLTRESSGAWFMVLQVPFQLEPDAVSRLIPEAVGNELDACALLPRLDVGFGLEMLTTPMVPWLSLTFSGLLGGSTRTPSTTASALLVRRETCQALESNVSDHLFLEPSLRFATMDGYDSVRRRSFSWRETSEGLASTAGYSPGRVILFATLLPLLFTAPIAIAIWTKSFAWIVGTVFSYWIRFRVAARSGETIPLAFFHPVSALLASYLLVRWSTDHPRATTSDLERTLK